METSDQMLAVKAEAHKLILGVKLPLLKVMQKLPLLLKVMQKLSLLLKVMQKLSLLLKVMQKLPLLVASLTQFLGGEDDQNAPMMEPGQLQEAPQPQEALHVAQILQLA